MTGNDLFYELAKLHAADPTWLDGPVKVIMGDSFFDLTEVDAESHDSDIDPSGSGEVTLWLRVEPEPAS